MKYIFCVIPVLAVWSILLSILMLILNVNDLSKPWFFSVLNKDVSVKVQFWEDRLLRVECTDAFQTGIVYPTVLPSMGWLSWAVKWVQWIAGPPFCLCGEQNLMNCVSQLNDRTRFTSMRIGATIFCWALGFSSTYIF